MDDDLMRIFGGERVKRAMEALNMPEDMPIANSFITSSIESAQKRVEGRNFDIRKHIVEYDDVMNYHRDIIYKRRRKILFEENIKNEILLLIEKEAESIVMNHRSLEGGFDYKEIFEVLSGMNLAGPDLLAELESFTNQEELITFVRDYLWAEYEKIENNLSDSDLLRKIEREVYLSTIDTLWMEHIDDMSYLRQNVALHAYSQRDPLLEYKDKAYSMFHNLLASIQSNAVGTLFKINFAKVKENQAETI
jgi:preprotein translocase subunit SecA